MYVNIYIQMTHIYIQMTPGASCPHLFVLSVREKERESVCVCVCKDHLAVCTYIKYTYIYINIHTYDAVTPVGSCVCIGERPYASHELQIVKLYAYTTYYICICVCVRYVIYIYIYIYVYM